MSEKFTQGPWRIWTDTNGRLRVGPSSNYSVAEMFQTPLEGQKANAHLIAAAPELLEFVKEWLERQGSDYNYMAAKASAVILKATGSS